MDLNQAFFLPPNRVWRSYQGGENLDRIAGSESCADSYFPEDWIGSATRAINPGREAILDEGISKIVSASGERFRLDELIQKYPEALLGEAHLKAYGQQTALLVKLLDSKGRLHIQAHPTAAWAQERLDSPNGKTEAWWVLSARDPNDSWVYLGFQHPPTPEEWGKMLHEQDTAAMLSCFDKVPVKSGDVLLVEGGVPHAIGPGVLLVEIMEPSDWVVRCEFNHSNLKSDPLAQTMGLGVDQVLDLFRYDRIPANEVQSHFGPQMKPVKESSGCREIQLLAKPQTDCFEMRRIEVEGAFEIQDDNRFSILIVLEGSGRLVYGGSTLILKKWDKLFLPAILDGVCLEGEMMLARCMPPKP